MDFERTGLILNTQHYEDCVRFYGSVLGLPISHRIGQGEDEITVFELGESYLMVEHGGTAQAGTKAIAVCPTKFRFNVADIDASCAALRQQGIAVTVIRHTWGTTAEFADPDGNRCALRSEKDFGPA